MGNCFSCSHHHHQNQLNPVIHSSPEPPLPAPQPHVGPQAVVPYVDDDHAKRIKNDVNVLRDSIKLVVDDHNLGAHLVTFTFDALVDGSITIFYMAKEGPNCTFTPTYPEICVPRRISFKKGLGQKFCQPSGTGIDLGFFELGQISKPSTEEDVFPLVISAEVLMEAELDPSLPIVPHAQITEAVLDKNSDGCFQVKVFRQVLWMDGIRYELREIYGISNSDQMGLNSNDAGEECVICMTDPKDTAALPCLHMCLCSECAKELRLQTNKCPICRQPMQELLEIKINKNGSLTP